MPHFENRLKEIRTAKNLSLKRLTYIAKVPGRNAIYYYEAGTHQPGVIVAIRIAKALGVSVEDIWKEIPKKVPEMVDISGENV